MMSRRRQLCGSGVGDARAANITISRPKRDEAGRVSAGPVESQRTLTFCFASSYVSPSSSSSPCSPPPTMTTAPPRTSTSPRFDNLNEGFISPARLQQWKQEHERVHSLGTSLSQPPVTSPQPDVAASRPVPERRNTSSDFSPNANGSPSKHRSKPSFSFFTRKSSNETPPLSSPPANSRPATSSLQSQQGPSQPVAPARRPIDGEMNSSHPSRLVKQQPQPPPQTQQQEEPTPEMNAASAPQPQPAQLHPEIRSVVQLTLAHAHKVYFSGPLIRRIERQPDGHKPAKDDGWKEVWAQLGGTTLSVWDMSEIQEASKQGKQVPPAYINITDAVSTVYSVCVCRYSTWLSLPVRACARVYRAAAYPWGSSKALYQRTHPQHRRL